MASAYPINSQVLPSDAPRNLLAEVLSPEQMALLEAEGELNVGFPLAGVGRFRVSAMRQRGSIAAVIRYITVDIPSLANLQLPPILGDLIMEKRGLLLMVGGHGRRQKHHAGVDDGLPQRECVGPHPDH